MSAGVDNTGRGRAVYTRGPVIVTLEILSAISALCAIAALVISLSAQSSEIDAHHRQQIAADRAIQVSRQHSARDTCELLRGLVLTSTTPARIAQARAFVARTPLRDCRAYSVRVTRLPRGSVP
jgi:hypothetical protein